MSNNQHEVGPEGPTVVIVIAFFMLAFLATSRLNRIANALDRAYPQTQNPRP